MNIAEKKEILSAVDEEMLLADGFEDALIGYVQIAHNTVALYDMNKCREILISQGMTEYEADEYISFNVTGAYMGEKTPAFAYFFTEEKNY